MPTAFGLHGSSTAFRLSVASVAFGLTHLRHLGYRCPCDVWATCCVCAIRAARYLCCTWAVWYSAVSVSEWVKVLYIQRLHLGMTEIVLTRKLSLNSTHLFTIFKTNIIKFFCSINHTLFKGTAYTQLIFRVFL